MTAKKDKDKKKEKQQAVKTFNINKSLKCDLGDIELLAAGQELAEACDSHAKLEEDKKSVMAGYTARLKEKAAQVGVLQSKVQNKFEFRQVACDEKHDYKTGFVTITRKDTNEEVESREMTSEEKQGKMFDETNSDEGETQADAA